MYVKLIANEGSLFFLQIIANLDFIRLRNPVILKKKLAKTIWMLILILTIQLTVLQLLNVIATILDANIETMTKLTIFFDNWPSVLLICWTAQRIFGSFKLASPTFSNSPLVLMK